MASPCRLILALDVETKEEAMALARPLAGNLAWVKLGLQLFTRHGPGIVDEFHAMGFKVFLDLKFHDIPNTVSSAIKSLKGRPCSLLTIHACGGPEMIARAAEAAKATLPDCKVLGVTVLTSMDQAQLAASGIARTPKNKSVCWVAWPSAPVSAAWSARPSNSPSSAKTSAPDQCS